jgi:hypothetical protein
LIVSNLWLFWPGVARIASHQLSPDLRVKAIPEAGEVGGGLDRAMVGGEEVGDDGCSVGAEAGRLAHAEEVLEAGGDPGRFALLVVDLGLATALEADADRRELLETASVDRLLKER